MPVGAQVDCLAFELIDCCEEKMRLPASMLIVATSAEIEGLVKYALLPELVRVRVPLPALVNVAVVLLPIFPHKVISFETNILPSR